MTTMTDEPMDDAAEQQPPTALLRTARRWFSAYRRTRPFWGSVPLILAGAWVLWVNSYPVTVVLSAGWNAQSGYIVGGGMIVFGVTGLVAPFYARVLGIFGVLMALAAFVATNLGGFLIGSLLGVFGGSMMWGWGEKRPREGASTTDHE